MFKQIDFGVVFPNTATIIKLIFKEKEVARYATQFRIMLMALGIFTNPSKNLGIARNLRNLKKYKLLDYLYTLIFTVLICSFCIP